MWVCPKCGEKIEGQFESCWKCASKTGEIFTPPATPPISESKRPLPFFGILSLVFPFFGIPFAYFITTPTQAGWGWGPAVQLFFIAFSSVILGLFSSMIGLAHKEKYIGFSIVGLVLNGGAVLLAFTF